MRCGQTGIRLSFAQVPNETDHRPNTQRDAEDQQETIESHMRTKTSWFLRTQHYIWCSMFRAAGYDPSLEWPNDHEPNASNYRSPDETYANRYPLLGFTHGWRAVKPAKRIAHKDEQEGNARDHICERKQSKSRLASRGLKLLFLFFVALGHDRPSLLVTPPPKSPPRSPTQSRARTSPAASPHRSDSGHRSPWPCRRSR